MIEKFKNIESSIIFVTFITGVTAFFLALILRGVVNLEILFAGSLKKIFDLSAQEFMAVAFIVLFGFFVHGIRYLGFDYYRKLYDNNQKKRGGKRTVLSRCIFYMFRNGTTVEEVANASREAKNDSSNNSSVYDWIRNSEHPERDLWINANKINNEQREANIYRFYYHSEVFQCLDTLFLLMTIPAVIFAVYFLFTNPYIRQQIFFCIYAVVMLLFHKISKATSKSFCRRFFLEIEVALKYIPTKNSEEEE
ncbi:MAG: hypothetical protein IKP49_01330 [Treponema sp.]|nr:hypothetical protein [Treponema sp.]